MAYYRPYGFYDREFNRSDLNHDGRLDRNEFRNMVEFQNADFNHDGFVGFSEFAIGAAPHLHVPNGAARQAFNIADRDHNGVLDHRELAEFSNFQYADLNHDGRIDPMEMRLYRGRF